MPRLPLDPVLRSGGSLLLALGLLATRSMIHAGAVGVGGRAPLSAYLLALFTFLAVSVGAALLGWGRHLFDRIEPAPRWKQYHSREYDG